MRPLLYQVAMALGLLIAAPFLLLSRGRHYLPTLLPRLGMRYPRPGGPSSGAFWVHAVSVGEAGIAATLLRTLRPRGPIVVTTITPTGQAMARQQLDDSSAVTYLPFDLGFAIRRFLAAFEPRALVIVEGDLWPLLLRSVRRRNMPCVVVNGRISDRNFARLRRLVNWIGPLVQPVELFAVQTEVDRQRLLELGVPSDRIQVTGNLKFETAEPKRHLALEAAIATAAGGRPILIAGSTMSGEEAIVLDAFAGLESRALLVLVPRHPERWEGAAHLVSARRMTLLRRSEMELEATTAGSSLEPPPKPAVLLLDSLGELAGLYANASAAFIGGTLVNTGGHNPLEAARFGLPIAVGPSMHNFADMASLFDRAVAWQRVDSASELNRCWSAWIDDPESARRLGERAELLVQENRGAMQRTRTALVQVLGEPFGE